MMKLFVNNAVDSIQVSKKIFVDTVVKHEGLAKVMNEFVDAQTEYTKKAVDVGFKTSTDMYKVFSDKSFYADSVKTFQETVKSSFDILQKGK
jgi:hypothetical protein